MARFTAATFSPATGPSTTVGALIRALATADIIPMLAAGFMTVALLSLAF